MENKVFLIYLEGESDDALISPILEYLVKSNDKRRINVEILFGDPFSNLENRRKSGKTIVGESIQRYLDTNHLHPNDIVYVAFVTDLDGIYTNTRNYVVGNISDNDLNENFKYDFNSDNIVCKNDTYKNNLIKIRQEKARKIANINSGNRSYSIRRHSIPYGIFYNSINLEHVVLGRLLPDSQKIENADNILDRYYDNPDELVSLFTSKSVSNDYETSWKLAQTNSLGNPLSNLKILFNNIKHF